jgi:glyoxylate reductase
MNQPKVLVTRKIPQAGLRLIEENCEVILWDKEIPPDEAELITLVPGVSGILSLLTDPISAHVMDAAGSQLKVISNYAVGFNNIDVAAANQRGIAIGNTPDVLTDATADFAFTLLLSAARRIIEAHNTVRNGEWKTWGPTTLLGKDLVGATLGLIGFGRIGQAMAKRALGFEMRVLFYSPSAEEIPGSRKVDLDTLLAESDFISLHVPLTEKTRHMINAAAFEKMKTDAILINTARGDIIDQEALYQALNNKRILSAAIDVTSPEPLPMDSPLLELDNLLISPHIGSATYYARDKMAVIAANNLLAGLRGEPLPFIVNPQTTPPNQ